VLALEALTVGVFMAAVSLALEELKLEAFALEALTDGVFSAEMF